MDVFYAIQQSAHLFDNPNMDMGYGIPDFEKAFELLTGKRLFAVDEDSIVVYPNPFVDQLTFSFFADQAKQIEIELYNVHGQFVYYAKEAVSYGQNDYTLTQMPGIETGLYVLKVTVGTKVFTERMLKLQRE